MSKKTASPKLSKKAKKREVIRERDQELIQSGLKEFRVGDWVKTESQIGQIVQMTPLYRLEGKTIRSVEIWVKTYGSEKWIGPDGNTLVNGHWLPAYFGCMTKIDKPNYDPEVESLENRDSIDISQFVQLETFEKLKDQETLVADSKDANPELLIEESHED